MLNVIFRDDILIMYIYLTFAPLKRFLLRMWIFWIKRYRDAELFTKFVVENIY